MKNEKKSSSSKDDKRRIHTHTHASPKGQRTHASPKGQRTHAFPQGAADLFRDGQQPLLLAPLLALALHGRALRRGDERLECRGDERVLQ